MNQMVNKNKNNNSINSLVFGRWLLTLRSLIKLKKYTCNHNLITSGEYHRRFKHVKKTDNYEAKRIFNQTLANFPKSKIVIGISNMPFEIIKCLRCAEKKQYVSRL